MKKSKEHHKTSLAAILPLVESLPQAVSLQAQSKPKSSQGRRMAAVLQRMADRNALSHIDDPAAWQREIRKDRPLPGREIDNIKLKNPLTKL
ncbi:MAG: hypothetical protein D3921_05690 [Candidatus Electrothrix sp. AW1]|nr:hypothetical protein [Candidatus Electrothrix sp. AX1]MCI5181994.1 hypothetical protein [Candidatus Electrothrix gigas]